MLARWATSSRRSPGIRRRVALNLHVSGLSVARRVLSNGPSRFAAFVAIRRLYPPHRSNAISMIAQPVSGVVLDRVDQAMFDQR